MIKDLLKVGNKVTVEGSPYTFVGYNCNDYVFAPSEKDLGRGEWQCVILCEEELEEFRVTIVK
jgi:hypothetical protein